MKFKITFKATTSYQITVKADSKDDAVDKAWAVFGKSGVGAEWDVAEVLNLDEEKENEKPEWEGAPRWEAWRKTVKPGDMCLAGGGLVKATVVTEKYLWATPEGHVNADHGPWEWEQTEPLEDWEEPAKLT